MPRVTCLIPMREGAGGGAGGGAECIIRALAYVALRCRRHYSNVSPSNVNANSTACVSPDSPRVSPSPRRAIDGLPEETSRKEIPTFQLISFRVGEVNKMGH